MASRTDLSNYQEGVSPFPKSFLLGDAPQVGEQLLAVTRVQDHRDAREPAVPRVPLLHVVNVDQARVFDERPSSPSPVGALPRHGLRHGVNASSNSTRGTTQQRVIIQTG